MPLRYTNAPMDHAEALDIAIDLSAVLARRDSAGRQHPGTTSVRVTPRGDGFDVCIPAEHAAQVVAVLREKLPAVGRKTVLSRLKGRLS